MNETKKLYRLDHSANVHPNLVRPIWVALCFAGTAGLWLYVAAALLLPKKSQVYPGW